MSDIEGWRGEIHEPRPSQSVNTERAGLAASARERISAVNFKNLIARLQSPSIQVSIRPPATPPKPAPAEYFAPENPAPPPKSSIEPAAFDAAPVDLPPNHFEPAPILEPVAVEVSPAKVVSEQVADFDPVQPSAAIAPKPLPEAGSVFTSPDSVDVQPAILQAINPDASQASAPSLAGSMLSARVSAVVETVQVGAVTLKPPPILPAPIIPTKSIEPEPVEQALAVTPITNDKVEPAPIIRRQRDSVEIELEQIMREISAVPTQDERLEFLDRAAELTAQDERNTQPQTELAQIEERFLQSVNSGVLNPRPVVSEPEPFLPQPVAHEPETIERAVDTDPLPYEEVSLDRTSQSVALENAPEAVAQFSSLEGQEAGELARSLLDMMAAGGGQSQPHERALAADTLLRLLPRLDTKPLILLAERLAMMDQPPHLLVAKLIRDPRVDISGPLLENSNHVTDLDLSHVIAEGTAEQRRVIARRRKLTRLISDKLVACHEPQALLTLVRNANAEISHEGYLELLAFAKKDKDLLAPLCTRSDLPAPFAFELFWISPPQLRRYILSRFLTDSETLTKILKITMATQGAGEQNQEKSFPPPELVERGIAMFAEGHALACDEHFANLLSLDPGTVARVMSDKQGDPLAIMLKAAGVSRADFAAHLVRLRTSDYAVLDLDRSMDELQALFDQMSFNKARILLTYWDWASRKSGPYAPIN
jgi:uncharacterized protein (DUF2336 family)